MCYLYQGKQTIVNHVNKMNVALNENIDDIITCEICTNLIDIRDGICCWSTDTAGMYRLVKISLHFLMNPCLSMCCDHVNMFI